MAGSLVTTDHQDTAVTRLLLVTERGIDLGGFEDHRRAGCHG